MSRHFSCGHQSNDKYTRQGNTYIENGQINTDLYRFVQIYTLSVPINTCLACIVIS
jgi:hypothetical protein